MREGALNYWGAEGLEEDEVEVGGLGRSWVPRAGLLRARLRLSRVTPLPSFVSPTTGGSPFFTNSQRPAAVVLLVHRMLIIGNI